MNDNASVLLDKYVRFLGKPTTSWYVAMGVLGIVVLVGFYALIQQIVHDHIITGMRDNVVWGAYIVNFIFMLGLSYAGAIISGVFHLGRIDWGKPLIRIIEIIAFITILIGPVYILLCIGRLDRLHYLFIYARIQSPIIWDLIAVMIDLLLSAFYLYLTFIKDFSLLHQNAEKYSFATWQKKLFKFLALGYSGTENQKKRLNRALDVMAALIIPTAVVAYSLLAWLFGMNLKEGWSDSLFAPYFIISAIFSGFAIIVILMWIVRRFFKAESILTDGHFNFMAYGMFIMALIFGYFTFSDYITRWYNTTSATSELIHKYLSLDQYGYMTLTMLLFTSIVPILVVAVPALRNRTMYLVSAILILIGLWMFRYLIIVPVLETPYIPIVSTDPAVIKYTATWIEWALVAAGFAGAIMLYMVILKIIPVFPISEMQESHTFKLFGKYSIDKLLSQKDFS
ncbi:MAG: polysulfide reductase NrfD [Cyclobacteriaceae bacterium]|nr:polysulfide reductase NrfD [Cyclobacteriaceae bacterium]